MKVAVPRHVYDLSIPLNGFRATGALRWNTTSLSIPLNGFQTLRYVLFLLEMLNFQFH